MSNSRGRRRRSEVVSRFGRHQERSSSDAFFGVAAGVFFALPAVLAPEVGHTAKTIERKRLVPDSLTYPVPTQWAFLR